MSCFFVTVRLPLDKVTSGGRRYRDKVCPQEVILYDDESEL